jgi:signal transduction histidine kinase
MANFRRPVRSRPIRLFLISMFALPLVSLIALWGFAASITINSAITDHDYNSSTRAINSGISALTVELPQERLQAYLWLLGDRRSSDAALLSAEKLVNQAIPVAQAALLTDQNLLSARSRSALDAFGSDIDQIGKIRQGVDSGTLSPTAAFQDYSNIVDAEFHFFVSSAQDRGGSLTGVSIGASDGAYSLEMAGREAALVDGALADRGQMSAAARELFAESAAQRQSLLNECLALMPTDLDASYVGNSAGYQQFTTMESQVLASTGSTIPVNPSWPSATGTYLLSSQKAQGQAGNVLAAMGASQSDRLVTEAVLAGGVGLVAVLASVFLLGWFGRKVTGDLGRLHTSVRGMAEERLPRVVERLRQGEDVDVAAESPPPQQSTIQEISNVAQSFATVQGAAVSAAVDQARLRKGVNQVFQNISMRNQSLLHRQLGLLDLMERRTSDPETLAELFRLDHLTTRMRRHAEGLIILSGSTPGRGWREPVPVVDVLRAAVAEVEDYVRVDVVSESRDLVAGNAVNDIIHLAAELVENATVFSPPNTRIEVRADRVGTGLVAEIEDRGLGLSEEERAEINRRLSRPPEFDLATSDQLGLFIVAQLAARHNIKVSLRESVYGGTTAILRLPFGVVVREEDEQPVPSDVWGPAANGSPPSPVAADFPDSVVRRQPLPRAATGRLASPSQDLPVNGADAPRIFDAPARSPWDAEAMTPWPQAFQPAESRGQAYRQEELERNDSRESHAPAPVSPAEPGLPAPTSSGSHLGMPIRVPQATLAPHLRDRDRLAGAAEPDIDERSPEATRDMMDMMQQGWQLGRVDDLDNPEGAPDDGTH